MKGVDYAEIIKALSVANFYYIIPAVILLFLSFWFRALRWRYLLLPISNTRSNILFSGILIGYFGNTILPAHLGELIRGYIVAKKVNIPMTTIFSTIITDRLIDLLFLLLFMTVTIIIFPLPFWVVNSGLIMASFFLLLIVVLLILNNKSDLFLRILSLFLKPFPSRIYQYLEKKLHFFMKGFLPLKRFNHYLIVVILSILIWLCWASVFYLTFHALGLMSKYNLTWVASLVLLVVTSISVVIPSSPGYIGTFHWLCQLSLIYLSVPKSEAITYAFLVHGVLYFPVLVIGFLFLWIEEYTIATIYQSTKMRANNNIKY